MLFQHSMKVAFAHSFPIRPLESDGDTQVVLWATGGPNLAQDAHVVLETSWNNAHWTLVLAGPVGDPAVIKTDPATHVLLAYVRARCIGGAVVAEAPAGSLFAVLTDRPLSLET